MPRRGWEIPEREATPEDVYMNRRRFVKSAGIGAAGLLMGCGYERIFDPTVSPLGAGAKDVAEGTEPTETELVDPALRTYVSPQNQAFNMLDRPLTEESFAASYNNFYEFTTSKTGVKDLAQKLSLDPWQVEVTGLVRNPETYDLEFFLKNMPIDERLYRLRCVEAWSIAVPWTGFPMKALIDVVEPTSEARFVQMTSFLNPGVAIGQFNSPQWPWPYSETLTMEEATNELTLLAVGIYGHGLPRQHGAPIRLVVPWKYGFKSIKSIVRIEFVAEQPPTFWNALVPQEYSFHANVEPEVPHPRWSQKFERFLLALNQEQWKATLLYNGYEEYVASLYS